jgi:RNA polymerase sigma-70 factor, ECF subfamily
MKEKTSPSAACSADIWVQAHLGRKLRELFEGLPEALPPRLVELVKSLAAKDKQHPAVNTSLKDAMLALIPNLRAFAFSLCGNHESADDLVQEALLKAWSHADSYQEGTILRAWLFTILRNSYFSEIRKRRREVECDGKRAGSLLVAPAQQGHLDMQDLRKALELLPPGQREAVVLVGAAGMSYEEAAKIGRCAVGTVKSRVNRARVKLAHLLGVESVNAFGPDVATEAIIGRAENRR